MFREQCETFDNKTHYCLHIVNGQEISKKKYGVLYSPKNLAKYFLSKISLKPFLATAYLNYISKCD